ncbi:DUF3048 domain-containing protein [Streptomyces sp. CB01881]|uniref:DUF3048 domain-containing protein n=1 Tax=Streptomyces sp. CB01881 TaxID=2078691 RepID=UPI000CDC123F|nr:DUF3048 domain-containing protein [Streptomyces sp. CB01881]AUY53790.1 DUF3048 domain-containing protein [Streptomyces sp. CB01881]TYC68800.1 DUF3048 domain-containing protein [Streptomyces sp. CB01881]
MRFLEHGPGWWRSLRLRRRIIALVVGGAVVLGTVLAVVLTVGQGGSPGRTGAGPPPAGPPAAGPAPSAPSAPAAPGGVSPLTGLAGDAGRVIAVKIDNAAAARPQTGVNAADVVYAIEVEGGLSRLLAVYDSNHLPAGDRIGPVRSARETDLPLLRQYGRVDFAYSGAQTAFLPDLARADVFNCSPHQDNSFFRGQWNVPPFNQYVVPSGILRHFPDAAVARDVGFRFGDAPAGGVPTGSFTARMPAASFTFTWSAAEGRYLVAVDGRPAMTTDAGQMGAPTVVVQKVAETTSPRGLVDSFGHVLPFAPTVGSGDAVFLRDGAAYRGSWSRPDAAAVTEFGYAGGRMAFHPGQVWIVLEPA